MARFRQLDDARGLVAGLVHLGRVAVLQGDDACAAAAYAECLRLSHAAVREDLALSLEGLAQVGARQATCHAAGSQMERAVRLFGAAAALGPMGALHNREEHERQVAAARAALGEDTFAAAWAEGQRLPLAQAIAEGLAVALAERGPNAGGSAGAHAAPGARDALP